MSARTFATSEPRGVFELAAAIKAKETSTGDCIEAINGIQIRAVDSLGKERQALEIIESDALSALVELLRDSDTIATSALLVPAFLALIRLSTEPAIVQELVRLDAPLVVARFLTLSEPDPRLQIAACLTLGNIALEASAATAVAVPEVVAAVRETVGSPHEAIQTAAVTCLSNIAGSTRGREQLLDPDTISTLSDLLQDDHSDALQSAAAFAIGNILADHDIEAQDHLREIGALGQLVLLLSPAFPEDTSSSAAWAIHHGAHLNHESQSQIAAAGGLALLVGHLSAATETLQTNALLALESVVASHEANQDWCRAANDGAALDELRRVRRDDGEELNASAKHALDALLEQLEQ